MRRDPERSEKKYPDEYPSNKQNYTKDRYEPEYRPKNPVKQDRDRDRDRDRSRLSYSDRSRSNNKDLEDSYAPGKNLRKLLISR